MSIAVLPGRVLRTARRRARGVSYRRRPALEHVVSQPCTMDQIDAPLYATWCERLQAPVLQHRKTWEWVYIVQALEQHGMLQSGRRGLGFGVGNEPITAYIASRGPHLLATDLAANEPAARAWRESGEHADGLADLNRDHRCPDDDFAERVSFREVDMRAIPDDLESFDFVWSSCAMEHLGSLDAGLEFFERQLSCLRPGGVGVHTTEYNVDPDGPTIDTGPTVLYQRRHLEELTYAMRRRGHRMTSTFALGDRAEDLHVDRPPYSNTHIRMDTYGYVHTSFGLVVQR